MIDHAHTLLGFSLAGAAALREEDGKQNIDGSSSVDGFASSEVVLLEKAIAQTCWTGAREGGIRLLGRAISSLLKMFKEIAEGGFEI